MTDVPHRVLVPVEVLRGETIPEALVDALASVPVVLLGYHEIPEQTAPGQARLQFEEKAQLELEKLVTAFEDADGTVATRLVFTHDPMKTFERVAVVLECDAVCLLNPLQALERVLVPVRGDVNVTHIAELVGAVLAGGDADVTLFHVASGDDERAAGEALLESAGETLHESGVAADRILETVVVDDDPLETIAEVADDHDLVVIGESRPSIRDRIFGDPSENVAAQTISPVLVVRRRYLEMSEDERDERAEELEETADEFETGGS